IRFIAGRPCVSYSCTICVCAHAAYQVHKYTIFPIKTFAHLCYNINMYFEHYSGNLPRGHRRAAARGVCLQQLRLLVAVLACSTAILCLGAAPMKPMTVRQPAVAGSWYPADKSALAREINGYLQARRAVIHKIESLPDIKHLSAEVPLSEMFGFSKALPKLSGGRAAFSMEPCGYQEISAQDLDRMITAQSSGI
ncbi:MAG: hypothetical protein NT118_04555, partial [Lentisphaerae bacterium]|nr:hypothetical protein [Lentisphaerota bacterium]